MDTVTRIITINSGEEAMIRVNSNKVITLEFPNHLVSVYEQDGLIFQRVEKQHNGQQTQDHYEPTGDMEDTMKLDSSYHEDLLKAVESLYYEETQVETQIETQDVLESEVEFGDFPMETPDNYIDDDYYTIAYELEANPADKTLSRLQMEDLSELQADLFG
jgi:hypothetical protein